MLRMSNDFFLLEWPFSPSPYGTSLTLDIDNLFNNLLSVLLLNTKTIISGTQNLFPEEEQLLYLPMWFILEHNGLHRHRCELGTYRDLEKLYSTMTDLRRSTILFLIF